VDLSPTTRNRIHRLSGGYWVAGLKRAMTAEEWNMVSSINYGQRMVSLSGKFGRKPRIKAAFPQTTFG
jgi:hypothetical protein